MPRPRPPFRHQPYYCEENVWHLSQEPLLAGRPRTVVFIASPMGACPMWNQRAGKGKPIVWDYHVVLLVADPWEVWDLDTTLGLPLPALEYLALSFHPSVPAPFQPRFRLVDADLFRETFASDRAHMRAPDGGFQKPPPPWPPILAPGTPPNLLSFIDIQAPFLGEVLDLPALRARLDEPPPRH
jgi:hypothetical protein